MAIIEFKKILNSINADEKAKLIFSCESPVSFVNNEQLYLIDFEPENYELYVVVGDIATGPCINRSRIKAETPRYEKYADKLLNRGTNARLFIVQKKPTTYSSDSFLTYPSPIVAVENGLSISVKFDLKLTVDFCLESSMIKDAIAAYHNSVFSSANVYFITKLKEIVKVITDLHFESYQSDFNQIQDRKSLIWFIDSIEKSSNNLQERIKAALLVNKELNLFKINYITINLYCCEKDTVTQSSNIIPQMDTEHNIELVRIQNQIAEDELTQVGKIRSDAIAFVAALQMGDADHQQRIRHDKESHAASLQMGDADHQQRIRHDKESHAASLQMGDADHQQRIQHDKEYHTATLQMDDADHQQKIQHDKESHAATLQMGDADFEQKIRQQRIQFMEYAKQQIITISIESYDKYTKNVSDATDRTIELLEKLIVANHGVKINFDEVVPQIRSIFMIDFPTRQELEDKLDMITTEFNHYYSDEKKYSPDGKEKQSD